MLIEHLRMAATAAHTTLELDQITKTLWQGVVAGKIQNAAADDLSGFIQTLRERKKAFTRQSVLPLLRKAYRARPQTLERTMRRRAIAASGALPSKLAAHYTPHQLAVVSIVVGLLKKHGKIEKTVSELADMAMVSVRTVQRALKLAHELGHLKVEERRLSKKRNLPHLIVMGSEPMLRMWVQHRVSTLTDHKKQIDNPSKTTQFEPETIVQRPIDKHTEKGASECRRYF